MLHNQYFDLVGSLIYGPPIALLSYGVNYTVDKILKFFGK